MVSPSSSVGGGDYRRWRKKKRIVASKFPAKQQWVACVPPIAVFYCGRTFAALGFVGLRPREFAFSFFLAASLPKRKKKQKFYVGIRRFLVALHPKPPQLLRKRCGYLK